MYVHRQNVLQQCTIFFSPAPSTAQLTVLQVVLESYIHMCVCVTHHVHHTHAYILYFNLLKYRTGTMYVIKNLEIRIGHFYKNKFYVLMCTRTCPTTIWYNYTTLLGQSNHHATVTKNQPPSCCPFSCCPFFVFLFSSNQKSRSVVVHHSCHLRRRRRNCPPSPSSPAIEVD